MKNTTDRRRALCAVLLAPVLFLAACGSPQETLYGFWKAEGASYKYEIRFRKHDVRVVNQFMGMHMGDNTYDAEYVESDNLIKVKNVGEFQIINDDKIVMVGSTPIVFRRQ